MLCVLAASAFAQLSFSGSVYAGVRLQQENGDQTIDAYHREGWNRTPRFDFAATVTRENYGARLDTTFQMTDDPNAHFILNGIYGWIDFDGFLDNDALRLTMGQINSTPWVLPRFLPSHSEIKYGDVRGFRVEYTTPLPGLNVGMAFRAEGHDLQGMAERIIFGATYIHHLFSAVFAYDLSNNAQTLFGFNFTGIPDLTAGIQLEASRLATWDHPSYGYPGTLQMYYKVGYRIMRPLNVFLVFGQRFHGQSNTGPYWEITPGVEYRFLPNLLGTLSLTLDNYFGSPDNNLTINAGIEYTLRGPAVLYAEYLLRLDNMDRATHTFGFGITVRAF